MPTQKTVATSNIAEPSCDMLRETLTEKVTSVSPEEDLPTAQEILQDLPPQPPAVGDHCVFLFENLVAATGYLSSAYANLAD